jgi:hypothetical protein
VLLDRVLEWVLPPLTLAIFALCIFWFWLFTRFGTYSEFRNRPKRRRRRQPARPS